MRTVFVLGAGGPKAWPFHAGVLDRLAAEGLPPDDAVLLIGTSAGAACATATRFGAAPEELITFITTAPPAAEVARYRSSFPQGRCRRLTAAWPRAPRLLTEAFPGGRGFGVAAAGALPAGIMPLNLLGRLPGVADDAALPEGLWLPSVRLPDGDTVVFGRDDDVTGVRAVDAVQASSAVPWLFQAKQIAGVSYVDGAVDSPTHADLALAASPDLVVVSSVMSRPGNRAGQILARRKLAEETTKLRTAGVRTIVVAADAAVADLLVGFPQRGAEHGRRIASAAARLTSAALVS